jgi:hypothetical protein
MLAIILVSMSLTSSSVLGLLTIAELEQQFAPKKAAQTRLLASLPRQPELVRVDLQIKGVTGATFYEPPTSYSKGIMQYYGK